MSKSSVIKVGSAQPVAARNDAEITGSQEECVVCGKEEKLVSRGRCDACRKRGERENLEQTAKRRVLNERAEREKLLKIYHHFQTGYLQLGLSDDRMKAELLGLLTRCGEQFGPVLPLLNPGAVKSGHGQHAKASMSTPSTPVISATANGTGPAASNGAATGSKPLTSTATHSPRTTDTPDGTGTETTEEQMEVVVEATPTRYAGIEGAIA